MGGRSVGQSVGQLGGKGTGRPLYESLWARTFSGSFFCLKLNELYLERTWDGSVKDESGGMCSRELRVSITQLTI